MNRMPLFVAALIAAASFNVAAEPPGKGLHLPPGLQKKVARGQELPPGWKKKLQPGSIMDRAVYDHGVVIRSEDAHGIVTIRVEDEVVRLIRATREIVDILSR